MFSCLFHVILEVIVRYLHTIPILELWERDSLTVIVPLEVNLFFFSDLLKGTHTFFISLFLGNMGHVSKESHKLILRRIRESSENSFDRSGKVTRETGRAQENHIVTVKALNSNVFEFP